MNDNHQYFESYRRERNKRRLEGAPLRDLGDNAVVLRQLEAAEQRDVREQQLTREVHEFFQAATRQAAGIVATVTKTAEQELDATISRDMSDFLEETIRRAQELMHAVQGAVQRGVARQDLEPHMQNLVGPALDGFRYAGNLSTAETHIGQDPFDTDLEPDSAEEGSALPIDADALAAATSALGLPSLHTLPMPSPVTALDGTAPMSPLSAMTRPAVDSPQSARRAAVDDPLHLWFRRLAVEPEHVKEALKTLVRGALMTKDEARAIWYALHDVTA